ncbi:hypothetical protein COCVIDRAFT_47552, partial [Bipolaris victoriae FI3]
MAGLIAIGIGLGAEKLGRTISDKRLERKEKKAIAQHEAIYGTSSSAPPPPMTTRQRQEQMLRKRADAQRVLDEARNGERSEEGCRHRRSLSGERASGEEEVPPPSYSEAVREG